MYPSEIEEARRRGALIGLASIQLFCGLTTILQAIFTTIWAGTTYASGFVAGFFYILTAILGLCCARSSVRGPSSWLRSTAMTANIFLFIMMILGCVITIFVLLTAGDEIRSPVLILLGIFQTACLIPVCIAAAIMCTKIRSSALNYSSQIYVNRPPPAHASSVRIPAYTYSSVRPFEYDSVRPFVYDMTQ